MKHVECAKEFGLDSCMKTHVKASSVTEEKFSRGCHSAGQCDKPTCKESGDDKCEVYCCKEDNCNKSSVTVVSGTTLFICALLPFWMKLMAWSQNQRIQRFSFKVTLVCLIHNSNKVCVSIPFIGLIVLEDSSLVGNILKFVQVCC